MNIEHFNMKYKIATDVIQWKFSFSMANNRKKRGNEVLLRAIIAFDG